MNAFDSLNKGFPMPKPGTRLLHKFGDAYLPESKTIFSAMSPTPSSARKTKINTLVQSLIDAGVWAKGIQLLYFGAHAESNSFFNWFNPGTINGENVSAQFNVNRNIRSTQTSGYYAKSNFIPKTHLTSPNITLGCKPAFDQQDNRFLFCAIDTSEGAYLYLQPRNTSNNTLYSILDNSLETVSGTTSCDKHFYISRDGSNRYLYRNTEKTPDVRATSGYPDQDVALLIGNSDGVYSSATSNGLKYFMVTELLTDAEVAAAQAAFDVYEASILLDEYADNTHIISIGDKCSQYSETNSDRVDDDVLQYNPQWIVGVGDLSDDEFEGQSLSSMLDKFSALHTDEKVFLAWGNHEYDYDPTGADFKTYISESKSYYSKVIGQAEFFFYDNWLKMDESGWYSSDEEATMRTLSVVTRKASTQGQWLIAAMAASTAKWKILVQHSPIWGSENVGYICDGMQWDWAGYGIDMILQGHRHHYERLTVPTGSGNVIVITNGASGAAHAPFGSTSEYSEIRLNASLDSDLNSGFYLDLVITSGSIKGNLHSVKDAEFHKVSKDTFEII